MANDPYDQLPSALKKELDIKHGATAQDPQELPREQQLLKEAYERHQLAEKTLREAREIADRLFTEEAQLLAQVETVKREAEIEKEIKAKAKTLIEEATSG